MNRSESNGVVFVHHVLNRFPTCKQFLSEVPTKLRKFSLNHLSIEVDLSDMEETKDKSNDHHAAHSVFQRSRNKKKKREVNELESQSAATVWQKSWVSVHVYTFLNYRFLTQWKLFMKLVLRAS